MIMNEEEVTGDKFYDFNIMFEGVDNEIYMESFRTKTEEDALEYLYDLVGDDVKEVINITNVDNIIGD